MERIIEGQRGFKWWLKFVFMAGMMVFVVWFVVILGSALMSGHGPAKPDFWFYVIPLQLVLLLFVVISHLWFLLSYRLSVSEDGVLEVRGRKTTLYPFKDCVRIGSLEQRTKYESWRVPTLIRNFPSAPEAIMTRTFDNSAELEKAMLERVQAVRPDVEIDDHWLNTYGRPPYSNLRSSARARAISAGD
jgi:hypothetical protein